ncbi:MAG: enzyme of heme biosynthesis [Alistipes sp.]|nr:enzyme of heme biosynthesis [Alistipes sp.]
MKSLKLILAVAFVAMGISAMAQEINYDDPKYAVWGENAGERRDNMLNNQFLKEAVDNKNFSAASKYLKILLDKCPAASQNIYTNGAKLYKSMINAADTDEGKKVYIDSLMYLYDVRLKAFADHKKYGKDYILNRKAREFYSFYPDDREGIRKIFKEAVEASNEMKGKYDLELVSIYFAELCTDYQNDEIGAEELISAYDAYSPAFDGVEDEEEVSLKNQFDSAFGQSGAASCENLEALFSKKLAAAPEDETLLGQAVTLMSRANCDSDFFFATAEKFYSVKPSSETALFLAQGFQTRGEFEKAMKYLSEALATEQDAAEKEKLYVRIGLISIQTKNYGEAVKAANEIKAINAENGYAYFLLGQCYAASANCSELKCQACYWAAYDVMNKAVALLASEPAIQESAKKLAASFRSAFPTKEECFFNELQENSAYTVKHGFANGVSTTVRFR